MQRPFKPNWISSNNASFVLSSNLHLGVGAAERVGRCKSRLTGHANDFARVGVNREILDQAAALVRILNNLGFGPNGKQWLGRDRVEEVDRIPGKLVSMVLSSYMVEWYRYPRDCGPVKEPVAVGQMRSQRQRHVQWRRIIRKVDERSGVHGSLRRRGVALAGAIPFQSRSSKLNREVTANDSFSCCRNLRCL